MGSPGPTSVGWRPRAAVAAVLLALILPALRQHDSFPLSTYPMYARTRDRVETLPSILATDDAGQVRRLPSTVVARSDDPLITASLLRQAILGGRAEELCREIAARAPEGTVTVEVVEDRLDLVAAATGDGLDASAGAVLDRTVHARCPVPA